MKVLMGKLAFFGKIGPNFDRYSDFGFISVPNNIFFDFEKVLKSFRNLMKILGNFWKNGRYQNYKFRKFPIILS